MTIGEALSGRKNALNLIRLVLASLVIFSHSYPIGGYGAEPAIGGASLGTVAVGGFFAISGYLIAGSRVRLSFVSFLWRRCLRIFPAFWVCIVVTAFGFAPLAFLIAGESWQPGSATRYVLANSMLYISQFGVNDTLTAVPYPGAWNGSLWTLSYEFGAYLVAGVLLTVSIVRRHAAVVTAAMLVLITIAQPLATGPLHVHTNMYLNGLWLGAFFLAGMLVWSLSTRVAASRWLALASLASLVVVSSLSLFTLLAPLPFAYLLMWLGGAVRTGLFSKNDISYGVYIYAFPVQQILVLSGMHEIVGPWVFGLASLAITALLALGSWKLVEQPALRLKDRLPARVSV